jgi:prepilin-type N-terminal cleavage/methylation domain-containing protein
MKKNSSTKGFTLVEVLVAMSLFTIVSTIAAAVLVDVIQLQKKSSVQNAIYEDARILMQQLTNAIQSGTIDYEEYYSNFVVQKKKPVIAGDRYYGINYGVYSSRFYDPGRTLVGNTSGTNPEDLGVQCSYPKVGDPGYDVNKNCEIYFSDSEDLNTGQNPYKGIGGVFTGDSANAFCDNVITAGSCTGVTGKVSELYLIDSSGLHKTIFGLKGSKTANKPTECLVGTDCSIAIIKMTGQDLDQNGVVDVFGCDSDYSNCFQGDNTSKIFTAFKYPFIVTKLIGPGQEYLINNKAVNSKGITLPQASDLNSAFDSDNTDLSQFVPITPSRANIKKLTFTINPLEDPYKAYTESAMRTQPTVTINMTIGLASTAKDDYPGTFPDITLQTTVTAGVIGKIDSYPPVNDIIRVNGDKSWIYYVFNN